ncbi:DUF1801 domain-containing protein [uncultured Maribacter sp.]|uniref:DUF1801 domain-containing protein n=1 Tax=uncultured Maribacter sp. TaxID=431308 RepID=UPI0030D997BC|tara:strand:+ start:4420 stop:4875 length:456 start_codon:yes stop_codon:yes gene_type:complete
MKYIANSPNDYIDQLPQERREVIEKIRAVIKQNLPQGFEEQLSYGMLGYVVPHSLYPAGYHVNPELPLPFINVASQKNFVALYHSGIYANTNLLEWFVAEYPKHSTLKLNMGKSCIRFKNLNDIPYKLIAELCTKMTTKEWITLCEKNVKK